MELRHLRYFIAVAETGNVTEAAEKRLHTAQPSLSRQLRSLEEELGVELMIRRPRGIELTPAGRVLLDHARLVLMQVKAAEEATRRAAKPVKQPFSIAFITGHEVEWYPILMGVLGQEASAADLTFTSRDPRGLASALLDGSVDLAFMRREVGVPGLEYRPLVKEPLCAVVAVSSALARRDRLHPAELRGYPLTGLCPVGAPVLRSTIDDYARRVGVDLRPDHQAENLMMAFSLVASTGGLALLPAYARNLAPPSVAIRPLEPPSPTIGLVLGYSRANSSPFLRHALSLVPEMVARHARTGRGEILCGDETPTLPTQPWTLPARLATENVPA
jgi:LysR family hca operon transcriptional activator